MTFYVRDGGVWKEVRSGFSVRDGGVWKTVEEAFVKDGGAWKNFFTRAVPFVVTVGSSGGSAFGYSGAGFGSISPSPAGAIDGETINSVGTLIPASDAFNVNLSGTLSQDHFRSVMVEDDSGVMRQFDTAAATFDGANSWSWGFGINDVWSNASVGIQRDVIFIL